MEPPSNDEVPDDGPLFTAFDDTPWANEATYVLETVLLDEQAASVETVFHGLREAFPETEWTLYDVVAQLEVLRYCGVIVADTPVTEFDAETMVAVNPFGLRATHMTEYVVGADSGLQLQRLAENMRRQCDAYRELTGAQSADEYGESVMGEASGRSEGEALDRAVSWATLERDLLAVEFALDQQLAVLDVLAALPFEPTSMFEAGDYVAEQFSVSEQAHTGSDTTGKQ
jgi:hypothetical protein